MIDTPSVQTSALGYITTISDSSHQWLNLTATDNLLAFGNAFELRVESIGVSSAAGIVKRLASLGPRVIPPLNEMPSAVSFVVFQPTEARL